MNFQRIGLSILKEQLTHIDLLMHKINPEDKKRLIQLREDWKSTAQRQSCHIYKRIGKQYFGRYAVDNFFDSARFVRDLIQQDTDELRKILDLQEELIKQLEYASEFE